MTQHIRVHGEHRVHGYAHWCIIGFPYENKCAVIASDQLGKADLNARMESMEIFGPLDGPFIPNAVYEISIEAGNIFFVLGDTYAEACSRLFQQWQPKDPTSQHRWQLAQPYESLPPG